MPLVSAMAASHAPNILLEPGAEWEDFMDLHYSMAPQGSASRPTLEQQKRLRRDAETAFAALRIDLEEARPDVLIGLVACQPVAAGRPRARAASRAVLARGLSSPISPIGTCP